MKTKSLIFVAVFIVFLVQTIAVKSQETEIATTPERYIDRPLTLHKNNLELGFGYQVGSLFSVFDKSSNRLNIEDAGISSTNRLSNLQFTWGITERIQLQSLISTFKYKKTNKKIREFGFGYQYYDMLGIETSQGFYDPEIRFNYLLLGNQNKISLSLGCGIAIPLAKYKPENLQIDSTVIGGISTYNFNYKYHNGLGAIAYNINMMVKLRLGTRSGDNLLSKINFRLYTDYYKVPSTVSTNDWHFIFDPAKPNGFTFQNLPVVHKEGDCMTNRIFIDYQPYSIVAFMLGFYNRMYFNGWNEISKIKIAENKAAETSLLFASHIQATPKLRIDQLFGLPIFGKNTESFFNIQVAFVYAIN